MELTIPQPLKAEHEELHEKLSHAALVGGRTGEAAQELVRLLHPHVAKEEEFALPPLGLLSTVLRGEAPPPRAAEAAIALVERLKAELPRMLEEHRRILGAVSNLAVVAGSEGRTDIAEVANALKQHARMKEEVLYPAAILLGEHLRHGSAAEGVRASA